MRLKSKNMIKIAQTQTPVSQIIRSRWSARAFADRPIEPAVMEQLFEAASWAASSMNEQPWMFLFAHRADSARFERFLRCLSAGNQPWAAKAAVLVLSLSRKNFTRDGQPNRHHLFDTGAAVTTMLLEAIQNDIYGHIMGGFDMEKTINEFGVDTQKYEIAVFIALGYLGQPDQLDEPYRSRELTARTRKKVSEFVLESLD